jgi:S-layer protein (TIGR01567 family)
MDGFRLKSVNAEDSIANIRLYLYKNASKLNSSVVRSAVAGTINGETNLIDASFIWNPQNFAGFNYDMKNDLGTENLKFVLTENNKLSGDPPYGVTYTTTAQQTRFEYGDLGHYSIIDFLGNSCFVSYADDSSLKQASKESNLLSNSKLGKVLIDSGERQKIQNGGTLPLQDGYEAKFYIDKSCNKTLVELYRNGTLVERNYLSLPGTYIYKKSLADTYGIAVLALHLTEANCTEGKSCIVDGVFQISENLVDVNPNASFGKMTIRAVDANAGVITMDNKDNAITLSKNINVSLMGDFYLKTADSDELRFYIYKPVQ